MHLVIDASFARALGVEPKVLAEGHELTSRIEWGEHHLVFDSILRSEWQAHASRFMVNFLTRMVKKRRYVRNDDARCERLTSALGVAKLSAKHEREIRKDEHLLHLALSYDRKLITLERELPKLLRSHPSLGVLCDEIEWIGVEPDKVPISKQQLARRKKALPLD